MSQNSDSQKKLNTQPIRSTKNGRSSSSKRKKRNSQSPGSELHFCQLELRQLLAGVAFSDSFATDTIGTPPQIQIGDVGQGWDDLGSTSPWVGTGFATSGFSAPRGSDIAGPSQWVAFAAPNQTANGVFSDLVSLNGSVIEFDFNPTVNVASELTSNGIFVKGEAGNLIQLQFSNNDSAIPFETSVPFEVIVNGLATGATGPAINAWSHITITLNESSWDLSWQVYDVTGGETSTLTAPVSTLVGLSYRASAGGGATGISFSSDGDGDQDPAGNGDGLMFISNVEMVDANDLPEALNDFVTLDINTNVSFDVLFNDVDDDELVLTGFTQPANGTLVDNGLGSFTYTPIGNFFGADQFDYTIDDGSGNPSTATAYVYTAEILGLPAYASNPNAPAVLYLDFDGDASDDPFDRSGDITSFTAFEQDLMRQSVDYIAMMFSMYDVNVTTVLTPDLPKAWIRLRSNGSGGAAFVGSFPNTTSRGWVSSSDRNLTTGLAHEFGHILNNTHQRLYDVNGTETAEYRGAVDGEGSVMGVDFSGNVVKWWWEHSSPTGLQNDLVRMADEIKNNSGSITGYIDDDHDSSLALATPASFNSGVWSSSGVINTLNDVDTFIFDWAGGDVDVKAFRVDPFTNTNRGDPSSVDIMLSVFDLDGNLVGYANPDSFLNNSGLDADVTIPDLAAGTYAVAIASHGDYADIGAYQLTVESGTWSGSNPATNGLVGPTGLQAIWASGSSVELAWNPVVGATSVNIERSMNNVDFDVVGVVPATQTRFMDAGGKDYATDYHYRVRAASGSGVSEASVAIQVSTRAAAVRNLRVSEFIGTSKVLDWTAQRTSGETGFRIERSTDGITFLPIATLAANTPSYTDSGLDVAVSYSYRVVTLDAVGDAAVTMEDHLVARYSFDDTTGNDTSSYGIDNNGVLQNGAAVIFDAARQSRVLLLDGVNDFVSVADSADINLGTHGNRTISTSINIASTSGRQVIYEEGGTTRGYNIYLDNGLLYMGAWGMNDSVANAFLMSASPLSVNQWYSVSLVNDVDAGLVTGYLDGVAFGSAASSDMAEHTSNIGIGRTADDTKFHDGNVGTAGNYFSGMLDDFRIYSVANNFNEAPSAANDLVEVADDQSVTISVLANDSDADGNALTITGVTQGSSGSVVINENGTLTYTPSISATTTDSFSYTVTDHQGGSHSATVNVQIYVTGLVAQYTFDDGTASDRSVRGIDNSGTLQNGAAVVSDPIRGNLLSLDGVDDYVRIPDTVDINSAKQRTRTISLSFNADDTTARQVLYEEGGTTRGYNVYLDQGLLYMGAWGMNGVANVYMSAVANALNWNHVTLVNDMATGLITGYLNNTIFATAAGGSMSGHTGDIAIGRTSDATRFHDGNLNGAGTYFAGLIDNVRIYHSVNRDPLAVADTTSVDEDNSVTVFVTGNDGDRDADLLTITNTIDGSFGSVVNDGGGSLTYVPNENFYGSDTFYYYLDDGKGGYSIGEVSIVVNSVPDGLVTDRHVFFDASAFDGSNDLDAIPSNKTALLPGETATYANISNYSRGINGLVIDVSGLLGTPTADDFEFRVGNDDTPSNWTVLASTPTVEYVTDAGGDYVKLTWPDNAIEQQWLQVRLLSNATTDLAQDDVFYFGNAIGETGNDPNNARVDLLDVALTRSNQSGFNAPDILNVYDINRDERVDLLDVAIARANQSGFTSLRLITTPNENSGNRSSSGDDGDGQKNGNGFLKDDQPTIGSDDGISDVLNDGRQTISVDRSAAKTSDVDFRPFVLDVQSIANSSIGRFEVDSFIDNENFVLEVQLEMPTEGRLPLEERLPLEPVERLHSVSTVSVVGNATVEKATKTGAIQSFESGVFAFESLDGEFSQYETDWRSKRSLEELRIAGSSEDGQLLDEQFAELFSV